MIFISPSSHRHYTTCDQQRQGFENREQDLKDRLLSDKCAGDEPNYVELLLGKRPVNGGKGDRVWGERKGTASEPEWLWIKGQVHGKGWR